MVGIDLETLTYITTSLAISTVGLALITMAFAINRI